jgi:hypothetical protein
LTPVRIAAGALLIAAAAAAFTGRLDREMRDFEVYWTAGARAAAAEPLYRESDGHYRFKYLPAFALFVAPLSAIPLTYAKAAWFALSLGAVVGLIALSSRHVPDPALGRGALSALTVVAMAKFYGHELVLGQANIIFGALVMAAYAAWRHRGTLLAGLFLGVAVGVKPYAVFLVPYLAIVGRWRTAVASSAAIGLLLVAPASVYGWTGSLRLLRDWWITATETSTPNLTNADSISVFAMYAKWVGWGSAALAASIGTIGVLFTAGLAVLAWRHRARDPEFLEVALVLTAMPLVTPQGWDYMLLLSTPLVMALIAQAPRLARWEAVLTWTALAIVAFSLFDVMGRAAYAKFMALSIITVCYLVLFVMAVRIRARGLC